MKNVISIYALTDLVGRQLRSILILLILCSASATLHTQTESEGTEEALSEPDLAIKYSVQNNQIKSLTATFKVDVEDILQPVADIQIGFYRSTEDSASLIGIFSTNKKGKATCLLTSNEADFFQEGTADRTYLAVFEGNEDMQSIEASLTIRESTLLMDLQADEENREIQVQLLGANDQGILVPVPDVDIALYVKRLFGLLSLTEYPETTDEDGIVVISFPEDIPGDENGLITVVSKVEDHEAYGNLEATEEIDWGIPLIIDTSLDQRQLWSSRSNAPWNLILLVNAVLIGVWGVIAYILYQIINIWRLGKAST